MSRKIPIHINEEDYKEVLELAELIGYPDVYGWFPKTLKFSITFTKKAIENQSKFIPDLKESEMALYFSSIQRYIKKQKLLEKAKKTKEMAEKV